MKALKAAQVAGPRKLLTLTLLTIGAVVIVGFGVRSAFLTPGHRRPVATPDCTIPSSSVRSSAPPKAGGYCQLVPPGQFATLPSDTEAAAAVHRSTWEPRPQNNAANHTVPPPTLRTTGPANAYGIHQQQLFGRITGDFTGTTDEIIQWVAAKWGLPDDLLRAQAAWESNWYQDLKRPDGHPLSGNGYGDFGSCNGRGSPPPSGYGKSGPSSFGLMQDKWCVFQDDATPDDRYGGWPWTESSTAYSLEQYAAIIRGCFEGWNQRLGTVGPTRTGYHAGDLWGCVGSWYSGYWYDSGPTKSTPYINSVRLLYETKPWLTWAG